MASFSLSTIPTATSSTTNKLANPNANKAAEDAIVDNIGRRNFLLGVSGLCATANLTTLSPALAAAPSNISDSGDSAGYVEFPVKLDKTVKLLVKRPAVNRTKEDKKKATEVLMVNGIRFDSQKFVKFDVLINDEDNVRPAINPTDSEFAGSFAMVPQYKGPGSEKTMITSGARFGITELLEDLKAEDDEYVLVTLVPKTGCEDVTISDIKIELFPNV